MFGDIYQSWMLALAFMDAAKRRDEKQMTELNRAEVNALYSYVSNVNCVR